MVRGNRSRHFHKTTSKELDPNPGFKRVDMDMNPRQNIDYHSEISAARFFEVPVLNTGKDVLNNFLRDILEDEVSGG